MKKKILLILTWIVSFYWLSFAWNEFSYENAKSLAKEYIANSSFDENWKDQNPHISWEWKFFYTDTISPSYIEFKVSCDNNDDCWFIMVNFDWDDVSVPIASTSWNTPSEVLVAKNGDTDTKNTKLYYFNPFEQYAENEATGNISSIDPQDDYIEENSNTKKSSLSESKIWKLKTTNLKEKTNKNSILKNKILKAKKEAKEFKKTDEFKSKLKELKTKKQTVNNDELSFKYLDMAMAEVDDWEASSYVNPGTTDEHIPWNSTSDCWSRTPCYGQYKSTYNWKPASSWCAPTAMAIVYWYYDRNWKSWLIPGTAVSASFWNDFDSTIKRVIDYVRTSMNWQYVLNDSGRSYLTAVLSSNKTKGINYAIAKWYKNSTSKYYTWSTSTLFSKIKAEIDADRPIIIWLKSKTSNAAHAVVWYWYKSWTPDTNIVRINMWWGYKTLEPTSYYSSNIDYNLNSMFYFWSDHYATSIVTVNIKS